MSSVTVTLTGMNCGHCAASVREEVSRIAGVTGVEVDVASGRVTIDSTRELDAADCMWPSRGITAKIIL
jgi:copper chaperone